MLLFVVQAKFDQVFCRLIKTGIHQILHACIDDISIL